MAIREVKSEWSPEQLDYVKSFLCHYESDVAELPECCVGSNAKVSETNSEYVVSSSGKWVTRGKAIEEGGMLGGSASKYTQPDWGAEHVENYAYVPETELTVMEDVGAAFVMSEVTGVTAGNSYTVIYNGTGYVCEAVYVEGSGVVLGNAGAMVEGAATTEDPFLIVMIPEDVRDNYMGAYVMVAPLDGSASFTLAIVGEKDSIYAIPAKYLEAPPKPLIVHVNRELTETDTDFATIYEAALAGTLVYLHWADELRALSYVRDTDAHFTRVSCGSIDSTDNIDAHDIIISNDNTVSRTVAQLNNVTAT